MTKGILTLNGIPVQCFREDESGIHTEIKDHQRESSSTQAYLHADLEPTSEENKHSLKRSPANLSSVQDGLDASTIPEHLRELLEEIDSEVSVNQRANMRSLISDFQDSFVGSDNKFGRTGLVRHTIDTGSAHPIKQAVRRLPEKKRAVAAGEIEKILEEGIIEPSYSPWAAPIVLVSKKDGSLRFCIEYRRLNEVIEIEELFDALKGACWFSTFDLSSGYGQVKLDEVSKPKQHL